MKLKTRIKISFGIMAIAPILLFSLIASGILLYQSNYINSYYGIEGTNLVSLYNPIEILTSVANNLHDQIKEDIEEEPNILQNEEYIAKLASELETKSTDLVVRCNGSYTYLSDGISEETARKILPDYGDINNISDNGLYYGGLMKCIIRQIDINTENGDEYSVSLITYLSGLTPRIKIIWIESMIAVVSVLFIISAVMLYWLYKATIIPLKRLKEATNNISEGNLDFVLEADGNDEIGDLCKDFEKMRQRLNESAQENLRSDKESKELISNISHDLKTPITAIKGYVEGLRDGVAVTEEKRDKYLKTIYNKAVEMDKLIDELTLYSKIDTNRIPYSFNRISAKEYFDDCSDSLGVELESKGIDFTYKNDVSDDIQIIADAEQLSRVINNIISNSIKYSRDVRIEIDLRIMDEGDFIRVEIQDNGMGISKNDLPYIFDRLYRADASRNSTTGGSGIGLAIVKKIIEDHGGRIWAESKEGVGTTMCFVLRKFIGGNNE